MPDKPKIKHLTVVGFAGQKNSSNYVNAGKAKLKKVKENIPNAGNDFSKTLEKTIENFKAESIVKINEIDSRVAEIKAKILDAANEAGAVYKDEISRLEHSKTLLLAKLEAFKEEGEDKWEEFKNEFRNDLEGFNKAIKDFIANFKKD
ncbi:MAG: hypothetical protein VB126_00905 [Paludibacter sp.]|nr:hypothetical protein [Paludibacter sp.]